MNTEIYDQEGNLLAEYDISLGSLKESTRTVHHEAVEGTQEVWHYETVREYPNGGKEVRKVVDVPGVQAQDAWDEEIPIYVYVPYTEDELAQMEAERNKPTQEQRIAALEARMDDYEKAYMEGVQEA